MVGATTARRGEEEEETLIPFPAAFSFPSQPASSQLPASQPKCSIKCDSRSSAVQEREKYVHIKKYYSNRRKLGLVFNIVSLFVFPVFIKLLLDTRRKVKHSLEFRKKTIPELSGIVRPAVFTNLFIKHPYCQ